VKKRKVKREEANRGTLVYIRGALQGVRRKYE
jgi:hypothetical protein